MLRLTLASLAAAAMLAACAPTSGTAPAPRADANYAGTPGTRSGRCGEINIGTPENPRYVHDISCSYGSN